MASGPNSCHSKDFNGSWNEIFFQKIRWNRIGMLGIVIGMLTESLGNSSRMYSENFQSKKKKIKSPLRKSISFHLLPNWLIPFIICFLPELCGIWTVSAWMLRRSPRVCSKLLWKLRPKMSFNRYYSLWNGERLTAILSYLRRADLRTTIPSVSLSDLLRNRTSSFSNTYLVILFLLWRLFGESAQILDLLDNWSFLISPLNALLTCFKGGAYLACSSLYLP